MIKSKYTHIVNFFYDNKNFINESNNSRPAVFFDRDGVIIKDVNYIKYPNDVKLEIGAKEILRYFFNKGIPIVIITNQSGIYRRLFSWEDYIKVTEKIIHLLGEPNPITAIYANGLGPDAPKHTWRKPSPEMILNASFTLKINLEKSLLIGDRLSDIKSGLRAGIKKIIHVETGHGINEKKQIYSFINGENYRNQYLDYDISFVKNLNELLETKKDQLLI